MTRNIGFLIVYTVAGLLTASFLTSSISNAKAERRNHGNSRQVNPEENLQLFGNRFFTFASVIRVNQIETSRNINSGVDESGIHTPEAARKFRETIEKCWPGARISWTFSWLALKDQRPNYVDLRKLVVSYHKKYGDEITFLPGGFFANMYNSREQVNRDLHEGLQMVSEMVGGGYRPKSVIAGFLSAENQRFLAEEEGIHVCQGNIWSQYAVDNGDGEGSISYPYYPSREHFCKPAQGKEDMIDCVSLDGWTVDFLMARYAAPRFINGIRCGSRQGVGPIETILRQGVELGTKAVIATTAAHFDTGFELNKFAWITCIWELSLVGGRNGQNGIDGLEIWLNEMKRRWPQTKCITHGEFGMLWRGQYKNNDSINYRFVQRGSGVCGSEPEIEIRWFMNKDFRMAFLRNWEDNTPEKVIDFTRYDLKAQEPDDPKPGQSTRNWSLFNRLNQKGIRPQDKPIDIGQMKADEKQIIKRWYPELLTHCDTAQPSKGILEDGFINPSIVNRPMALWPWLNGNVDTSRMVYELKEMKDKGMQGAFIWDVGALIDPGKIIPAGPVFLGDQSTGYISLALKTADRLGLNLGLMTQSSWNVGGTWVKEVDAIKELLSVNQLVEGPSKQNITIGIPKNRRGEETESSLITSIAIPYSGSKEIDYTRDKIIDLDEFTLEGKTIKWAVPEGKWEIISFFMSNTGQKLVCPSPNSTGLMIDHLSKKATKNHFDTLLARVGKPGLQHKSLKYLEIDSYEVTSARDWTPGFIEEFKLRYAYDPVPFLPLLKGFNCTDSILGKRFRGDYNRLVSDLMIENHYAQASDIADEHGMTMFAEAGHGGFPRADPLKAMGHTGIPMGEFWNRQRHWVTKEAASAAHIYGKTTVASESLTSWQHWQHGPTDYKQLCDIAFCEGLNQIVFHTFTHNPEIAGKPGFIYHAGEHINVNATWWGMARPFMDYLSRCSYMLREGNFVADVLLYYGDDAPNLVPPKRIDPNYTPDMPGIFPKWFYDETKCPHCGMLLPINPGQLDGYDYDYINAEIITKSLKAEEGKFVLPHGSSYRVMMIPDRKDISLEVLKSLEKLVKDGAVIIGPKPERSTSLKNYPACDEEVKVLADKIWGTSDGKTILSNKYGKGTVYWGKSLKQVLEELKIPRDFEVKGIDNCDRHLDYIHRQTETDDIYFLSNSNPQTEKVNCTFRVDKYRVPELWDAETGLIQRKVEYSRVEDGIAIELVMDPLASRFVVFRKISTGRNDAGLGYDLQYGFNHDRVEEKIPEPIDISYNWDIKFNPAMGGPESYHLDSLKSWSDIGEEGIKYYSGSASYERDFYFGQENLPEETEAFIVFGDIQEMARVFVNGNDCGIVWTLPYKAKITPWLKKGNNKITVQVINTWNNRIVGDLRNPDKKPFTSTNGKVRFNKNSPLLKSGLTGKADIIFTKIQE